ncbi:copper amine oxidase [Zopfia rhizophila CBS 207.26]|uniref:Amine oxidase n=1 Tax=Zopfia rhizophila CBS 207.26 TaxID=1314779 RepID=A0A6A6ESW1_9PEZI|nr:copper amine oxidase [Zopfia rhizophila CBS 207.26]
MRQKHHPFDPLSPDEITKIANIVRELAPNDQEIFRVITLAEPPKKEMVEYLALEHTALIPLVKPGRIAKVHVYIAKEFHEMLVDVDNGHIISDKVLHGRHSHVDSAHMKRVETACLQDSRIQKEIQSLRLPEGATVIVEPWTYATDGMNDVNTRITMCWLYMRLSNNPDANYYAYPLDVVAEVSDSLDVTKIYRLPSGANEQMNNDKKQFDHNKIHTSSEYHPDLTHGRRTTTRPLHVSQPEGPSFKVDGNCITWEKWTMRVGFNYREGMTLHDIRYDGRSLFYRLSLSEMFVPYGDPRCPYPRKGAFDVGNDGAGVNANNLKVGCNCLGHIKHFDGWHVTSSGFPLKLPNVICCHEVDDGILWKHTNFRTGNAVVTRSRLLVLQTIITVSNYEYVFIFYFGQDASIHYEVRATGILSTAPIDIGDQVPWGTVVAPGVLAPYHQHLFCLRIDPALDGHKNSLMVEESQPMPFPHVSNPFGIGYTTTFEVIGGESGMDLDHQKNRVFKIINESRLNSTTGTPVGFKLLPCYSQMLLAHPSSYHSKRSEFGAHAVWVTRYSDDELYAAGTHTMQSLGGEGIASWIKKRQGNGKDRSVRNEDIVLWHTFGSTHNPRIEDWPVMPCEKMIVGLKPVNFFDGNPGLDVLISKQEKD